MAASWQLTFAEKELLKNRTRREPRNAEVAWSAAHKKEEDFTEYVPRQLAEAEVRKVVGS